MRYGDWPAVLTELAGYGITNINFLEEPYSTSSYTAEQTEYAAMCESVETYGGFYIARFEAGYEESGTNPPMTDAPVEPETPVEEPTILSKKGVQVITSVPWGESMTDIGEEGAVYLSKQMYANHESVVSTLCYGVQWDAAMKFVSDVVDIYDSTSWGNYSDSEGGESKKTTGYSSAWQAKNIYDLAGNVWEWTMEPASFEYNSETIPNRAYRGGDCFISGSDSPAAVRVFSGVGPTGTLSYLGFRPSLYIKVE